ncbi:alpha/beta hydrolase family protein [Kitasatospora sp. NPDC050543]|uniref:alpha/beta hydrolase family protein n=1 Tax=Kitasatospora sp. NPDC050543 TaxID=3364054 RepID=UPI0037B50F77
MTSTHPSIRRWVRGLALAGLLSSAAVPAAHALPAQGLPTAQAAQAASRQPTAMTLPSPGGPYRVGITDLHLVDRSRPDPWRPEQPSRELMVSLWYPARPVHGRPPAPQLPPGTAGAWGAMAAQPADQGGPGIPLDAADWAGTRTHAQPGVPVQRRHGGLPVVLYSPGRNVPRGMGTVLAEELASRGYLVVSIDHTYETTAVEFPGGRVAALDLSTERATLQKLLDVRVDDTRFVLDQLAAVDAGRNPDAEHRPLPAGLSRALDLSRTGMFGHSIGGATAAQVMHDDPRVKAAADLDGGFVLGPGEPIGSVVQDGLDRPFLLMSSAIGDHRHPAHAPLWQNLRGWHRNVQLPAAAHYSYTDLQAQLPQLGADDGLPDEVVTGNVGTIDPARSFAAQRAYLDSFFDLHLRERDDHLLDAPSDCYPEARFVD